MLDWAIATVTKPPRPHPSTPRELADEAQCMQRAHLPHDTHHETCDFELWNLSFVHILGIWYLLILPFKSNWCQNLLYLILWHILWLVFSFSFSFNRRYTQSDYMIQSNFKNQSIRPYYQYYLSQESVHLLKKIIQESVHYICLKRSQDRAPSMFTTLKTEQVKKPQDLF